MLRCVPVEIEMRVLRFRFWQLMARDAAKHAPVFFVMFGDLDLPEAKQPCTRDGRVVPGNCHPWLEQLCTDLSAVRVVDDISWLGDYADRPLLLLTDKDLAQRFCEVDFTVLRMVFLGERLAPHDAVVPPEVRRAQAVRVDEGADGVLCCLTQSVQEPAVQLGERPELEFKCTESTAAGSCCTASFDTLRALRLHQVRTLGGSHGYRVLARLLAVTNQCPACDRTFISVEGAKRHLHASFKKGSCRGARGNEFRPPVMECTDLQCPVCEQTFTLYEHFKAHIGTHLPQTFTLEL